MDFILFVLYVFLAIAGSFLIADVLASWRLYSLFFKYRLWDNRDKETIINNGDVIVTFADGAYGFKYSQFEDELIMCDRRSLFGWGLSNAYNDVIYGPMNIPASTAFPIPLLPSELMKRKIDREYLPILKELNSMVNL